MLDQNVQISDEEYYADLNAYFKVTNEPSVKTKALEESGWENWLKTLMPFAFAEEFSDDHRKFWELYFSVLLRIREQQKYFHAGLTPKDDAELEAFYREKGIWIESDEWTILLILGRGLGKSQTAEASAVMRGAILGGGYCLYICEAQDQAEEHIGNCRGLIENPESRIAEFYPGMMIDTDAVIDGMKVRDSSDLFITLNGWICRAKGLNARLRGLRIGGRRPDDIILDDIDGVNDSLAVSLKKLRAVTASVIPTQARRWATIKFAQNPITENSVLNQIYTGKSDALAERTTVGATPTFSKFDYETYTAEDGRTRHRILPTSIPTWQGVDIAQAQKFLNDSGLETFYAEYQNEFDRQKTGLVIKEYSDEINVITWSEFETIFGVRYIPPHWKSAVGFDIGYTEGANAHLSALTFIAVSAMNSALPNCFFAYRGMTFEGAGIDDIAEAIWKRLFPFTGINQVEKRHFEYKIDFKNFPTLWNFIQNSPEMYQYVAKKYSIYADYQQEEYFSQIVSWQMSHEKSGEMKVLREKYGLPFQKTKNYHRTDGVAQWNYLCRPDKTKSHPFRDDLQNPDKTYVLGRPKMYYIVADDQKVSPRDDHGFKIHREQLRGWRWVTVKLTENGLTEEQPSKAFDDSCDSTKMILHDWVAWATELTDQEQSEAKKPENLRAVNIALEAESLPSDELTSRVASRSAFDALQKAFGNTDGDDDEFYLKDLE